MEGAARPKLWSDVDRGAEDVLGPIKAIVEASFGDMGVWGQEVTLG